MMPTYDAYVVPYLTRGEVRLKTPERSLAAVRWRWEALPLIDCKVCDATTNFSICNPEQTADSGHIFIQSHNLMYESMQNAVITAEWKFEKDYKHEFKSLTMANYVTIISEF